ncbi:MAG: hypothetical protein CMH12_10135 [Maritimibacter sp.]|nr:hypothetical protein [Maritimibacter sp.]
MTDADSPDSPDTPETRATPTQRDGAEALQRVRTMFLGIATRRALIEYLLSVAAVMFLLTMIAYTIDLARIFPDIRWQSTYQETALPSVLLPYLLQRGVDIVTRMLPVAMFFGPFLAEIGRRLRLETVILATAGAGPGHRLAALLWLALILGGIYTGLEARWRPAAIQAQVETGLGDYAERYDDRWLEGRWVVNGDVAMRADLRRGAQPEMRNLLVFNGIGAAELASVVGAERAVPTDTPDVWRLEDVTEWTPETGSTLRTARTSEAPLLLTSAQLTHYGIAPYVLSTADLRTLARAPTETHYLPGIRTALWQRRLAIFLPGTVAFLAVAFATLGFDGRRILYPRLIGLAAAGYILTVSLKVFWALGQQGTVAPSTAVATALAVPLVIGTVAFVRQL